MKSKFEEFNDGLIQVYTENDSGELEARFDASLRYGEENVSIQRHYAAKASDEQVDKVIHIQMQKRIAAHDIVVIGEEQFDIGKIDQIKDALPPITKLSLIKLEKHRQKEYAHGTDKQSDC